MQTAQDPPEASGPPAGAGEPPIEAFELEELFPVSYAIFAMARTHRAVAATQLASLGLFPNQEIMLVQLAAADGLPQKVLAETLQVSHPTIAKTVARMERAGLVRRRAAEEDRRVSLVFLTDEGRRLHDEVIGLWRHLDEMTTTGLSAQEQRTFVQLAAKIRAAIDPLPAPAG